MSTFIVGTDTDVGKTYYGQLLMSEGKTVIKPIETGRNTFDDLSDSDCHKYAIGQSLPLTSVNLYFFTEPVSPHLASKIDGESIDLDALKSFISQDEDMYIELAGGLMVPIQGHYTQLDIIKETDNASVCLVIGNKLGCINHGLMTLDILERENIPIKEVVINNMGKEPTPCMINNIETIKAWISTSTQMRII